MENDLKVSSTEIVEYCSKLLVNPINKDYTNLIEIFIPTFNRTRLLDEAIRSAINQNTDLNYRISIVDNSDISWKDNFDLVKKNYSDRVFYYKNDENYGLFGNWNMALKLCNSEYFVLLHDDDLLKDNFIQEILKVIKKFKPSLITNTPILSYSNENLRPKPKFVLKRIKIHSENIFHKIQKDKIYNLSSKDYFFKNPSSACAMVINKIAAIKNGGWSINSGLAEDYYFNYRLAKNNQVIKYYNRISEYRYIDNLSLNHNVQMDFIINNLEFRNREIQYFNGIKRFLFEKVVYLIYHFELNNFKKKSDNTLTKKAKILFMGSALLVFKILFSIKQIVLSKRS